MNILSPAGWLYGLIADARNRSYDRGFLKSHSLGARTISIGNITAGGTGKTPLVVLVAKILSDVGERVCVLTRGYRRDDPKKRVLVSDGERVLADARKGGDEAVELAGKLLGRSIVVADADRVSAARWAREEFGVTAFVLDDGFQHRRARRDIDIVCVDATDPFGNGEMLPAGTLRERLPNLGRADAIVITRTETGVNIDELTSRLAKLNPNADIFRAETLITGLVKLEEYAQVAAGGAGDIDRTIAGPDGEKMRLAAFCALGNPDAFFRQLRADLNTRMPGGVELAFTKKFPDHHYYSQADIRQLETQARASGAQAFVTTAKDAVKLEGAKFEIPCYVVEIETSILEGDEFRKMITASAS